MMHHQVFFQSLFVKNFFDTFAYSMKDEIILEENDPFKKNVLY